MKRIAALLALVMGLGLGAVACEQQGGGSQPGQSPGASSPPGSMGGSPGSPSGSPSGSPGSPSQGQQ